MAEKKKKKAPTKLKKTAAGAQQYVDENNFKKTKDYIGKDFINLSAEAFKKKYGVNNYKLFYSLAAGEFAEMSDTVKSRVAKHIANEEEKKYDKKAKTKNYSKGGTTPSFKTCPACTSPTNCATNKKCQNAGK